MTERRTFLGTLAAGAVALPAATALGATELLNPCDPRGSAYFPNAVLTTHEGGRALFYDDLLKGRTVLIHFMSLAGEELRARGVGSTVANLARVQEILGPRLGQDVFIYSLTVDPENDSPRDLSDLARRHGAGPGWLFLTGAPEDMETIRSLFFVDRVAATATAAGNGHPGGHDCSQGLLRYGNEAVGLWGSCPQIADPRWIASRLSWVMPQPIPEGPHRRGGPHPRAGSRRAS